MLEKLHEYYSSHYMRIMPSGECLRPVGWDPAQLRPPLTKMAPALPGSEKQPPSAARTLSGLTGVLALQIALAAALDSVHSAVPAVASQHALHPAQSIAVAFRPVIMHFLTNCCKRGTSKSTLAKDVVRTKDHW